MKDECMRESVGNECSEERDSTSCDTMRGCKERNSVGVSGEREEGNSTFW